MYVESIRTIYGSLVKNKPDGMHGSMDEMKLEAKEWSLPGFKIVVDEEWADYVRPDVNFVMSEREMRDAYEVAAGRHRAVPHWDIGGILC